MGISLEELRDCLVGLQVGDTFSLSEVTTENVIKRLEEEVNQVRRSYIPPWAELSLELAPSGDSVKVTLVAAQQS